MNLISYATKAHLLGINESQDVDTRNFWANHSGECVEFNGVRRM